MNEVYQKLCQDLILIDGLLNQVMSTSCSSASGLLEKAQAIASLTQAIAHIVAAIKDLSALTARRSPVPSTYSDD